MKRIVGHFGSELSNSAAAGLQVDWEAMAAGLPEDVLELHWLVVLDQAQHHHAEVLQNLLQIKMEYSF